MAEHQRIALWTPSGGAAVFETVSSSMPDVLQVWVMVKWRPHQELHPEPHLLEAGHARVCYTLRAFE